MGKEAYPRSDHSDLPIWIGGIMSIGLILVLGTSTDPNPDSKQLGNNNPAILQIDRETCQGEDPSYTPLSHWTINPDEVAAHFESFTGLPDGTDTLGISWDRTKNQFTVTCLDKTP